jgi:hypothetical protein
MILYICQWFTSSGSTNGQKALEERKNKSRKEKFRSMNTGKEIVRRRYTIRGSYPFPLMSKGERKQKHEDRGSIGRRESMSVSINAKGGDCWKIGCH